MNHAAPITTTAPDVTSSACPLCHTVDDTVSLEMLRKGSWWRCVVCDQIWSATRLETAAAYARYAARA